MAEEIDDYLSSEGPYFQMQVEVWRNDSKMRLDSKSLFSTLHQITFTGPSPSIIDWAFGKQRSTNKRPPIERLVLGNT